MEKGKCLKRIFLTLLALGVFAIPINIPEKAIAKDDYLTYDQLKAYQEQKEEQEWSTQLTAYSSTLVGRRTGQCVLALRNYYGVRRSEVQGLAKNTKANTKEPKIGSVIILKMSWAGHVGIVIKVDGDLVTYFDSNGSWTQRGAVRTIIKSDRRIAGYRIVK